MTISMTLDAFDDAYEPEQNADGSLYRQRDWTVPEDFDAVQAAMPERRVWTMLDGGTVVSGRAVVNRVFYIITAHPYGEDESIEAVDPDAPDLDEEWDDIDAADALS
jgi:hypothetical protein